MASTTPSVRPLTPLKCSEVCRCYEVEGLFPYHLRVRSDSSGHLGDKQGATGTFGILAYSGVCPMHAARASFNPDFKPQPSMAA